MEAVAWTLSITSAVMLWLMGNKSKWGPRIGIVNQIVWLVYATATEQWGLLPGVVLYAVVHIRNIYRWETEYDRG